MSVKQEILKKILLCVFILFTSMKFDLGIHNFFKFQNMRSNKNILSGPPLSKNWTYKSAAEFFFEKMSKYGSATALISAETGEKLTYDQILGKSLKLTISLKKLGLKLNDRIGICSENNLNFGIVFLSSIFLGTSICPLNPSYTERELIHTFTISKPKYIFVSNSLLPRMQKVVKDLPWSPQLILLYLEVSNLEILNLSNLISKIPNSELKNFKLPEIDMENHVLLIACSSGTTGLPKGVMLSDKNILMRMQIEDSISFLGGNTTTFLGISPMFHVYGISILLTVLSSGKKLVVFSKFQERSFLQMVEKYGSETLLLVPPLMVFLAKNPIVNEYDLSCVKKIVSGAAPLAKEIEETVAKKFKLRAIHSGYGLTESTGVLTSSPEVHKVKSVGILVNGVQAKVVPLDEKSKELLGPNMEGELCFKGNNIMKGYLGDEKATKAAIDDDGFLHTGDVGYYDEDEYFYIVDRVKELIKYKGYQVPPAELESILLTHPKIRDAAVVGLPDEIAGELPLAFVVKQPGVEITADEIIKYVNDQVSPQKRLRGGVRFIGAIPKNPSGKILRRELRNILKSKF